MTRWLDQRRSRRPLVAALLAAAPAEAVTVRLGPSTLDTSGSGNFQSCGLGLCSSTLVQTSLANPGDLVAAPADGIIVSWKLVGSGGPPGSMCLRVIQPLGGGQYRGAGKSAATRGGTFDPYASSLADTSNGSPSSTMPDTLQFNAVVQLDVPVVSAVSPASGAAKGGETLTISGDHLSGATQVLFGSTPAPSFSGTNTQITTTAPAGAGTLDVRVVGPGGTSAVSAGDRYTYIAPDTTPPSIKSFSLSPSAFVAANIGGSIAATVGTRVSYKLSEAAVTTFHVQRPLPGRRRGKKCVRPGRRAKGKRCTRWVNLRGSFTHADVSGTSSFRFTGRLGGRSLKRGRYRLVAVSADGAGNKSRPAVRPFRIIR